MTVRLKTPEPPAHLSAASKAFWRDVLGTFDLEPHHLRLLKLALEAADEAESCRVAIERDGLTVTDRFGNPQAHPLLRAGQAARNQTERLLRALGLDVEGSATLPNRGPNMGANAQRRK